MTIPWDPDFAERAPMFEPLRGFARDLRMPYWPGCDDLNRILASRDKAIVSAAGAPLRFVAQAPRPMISKTNTSADLHARRSAVPRLQLA